MPILTFTVEQMHFALVMINAAANLVIPFQAKIKIQVYNLAIHSNAFMISTVKCAGNIQSVTTPVVLVKMDLTQKIKCAQFQGS